MAHTALLLGELVLGRPPRYHPPPSIEQGLGRVWRPLWLTTSTEQELRGRTAPRHLSEHPVGGQWGGG